MCVICDITKIKHAETEKVEVEERLCDTMLETFDTHTVVSALRKRMEEEKLTNSDDDFDRVMALSFTLGVQCASRAVASPLQAHVTFANRMRPRVRLLREQIGAGKDDTVEAMHAEVVALALEAEQHLKGSLVSRAALVGINKDVLTGITKMDDMIDEEFQMIGERAVGRADGVLGALVRATMSEDGTRRKQIIGRQFVERYQAKYKELDALCIQYVNNENDDLHKFASVHNLAGN